LGFSAEASVEESAVDKELGSCVCTGLPFAGNPDWLETAASASGEPPLVFETEVSFPTAPVLSTVPDPSLTSAVAESFPVDTVPSVGVAPEESVVVVEPSTEESVEESGGEDESEEVLPEESVEESGGEDESELGTASGESTMPGCAVPLSSGVRITPVFDRALFLMARPPNLPDSLPEVPVSALAKNPIGYVIIERESTSMMLIASTCVASSTSLFLVIRFLYT